MPCVQKLARDSVQFGKRRIALPPGMAVTV